MIGPAGRSTLRSAACRFKPARSQDGGKGVKVIQGARWGALAALFLPLPSMAQHRPPTDARQIECQLVDCASKPAEDEAEQSFSLVRPHPAKAPSPPDGKPPTTRRGKATGRLDMRLTFASGSAELAPEMAAQAKTFAEALQGSFASRFRFRIEGHTDSVGGSVSNQELSKRRAQAVVDYLVGQGVESTRLEAVGYGSAKPRPGLSASNPANRRVEIVRQD